MVQTPAIGVRRDPITLLKHSFAVGSVPNYCRARINVELSLTDVPAPYQTVYHTEARRIVQLSMTGSFRWNGVSEDGQCQATIRDAVLNQIKGDPDAPGFNPDSPMGDVVTLLDIWDEWHLNATRPNCIHQDREPLGKRDCAPIRLSDGEGGKPRFETYAEAWNRAYADQIAKCPLGYRYGQAWLCQPLPPIVIDTLWRLTNYAETAKAELALRRSITHAPVVRDQEKEADYAQCPWCGDRDESHDVTPVGQLIWRLGHSCYRGVPSTLNMMMMLSRAQTPVEYRAESVDLGF